MKTLCLLIGLALTGLASTSTAQEDVIPFNGPVTHVGTFNPFTGVWTRGPAASTPASGPDGTEFCFTNNAWVGNVTTSPNTLHLGKEYQDWATFATCVPDGTDQLVSFDIGWCANMANPMTGTSVGGTIEVGFYSGTNAGLGPLPPFGVKGTLIQTFTITGLPGPTTPGALTAFSGTIDISASPITIPNGGLGFSYRVPSVVTGTGGTGFGWMLIPVASSAPGNLDYIDRYLANGSFEASIQFVSGAPPVTAMVASLYMRLKMDTIPTCFGGVSKYGIGLGGINLGVINAGGSAKINTNITLACTLPQASGPTTKCFLYFSTGELDPGLFLSGFNGTLLIDSAGIFKTLTGTFPPINPSFVSFSVPIPNDVILIDKHVYAQALYLNMSSPSPFRLTDGVDVWINNCP